MPGYTHMQHAQPISYAHYLLAYFEMFKRDVERFEFNQKHTDVSPLGSCALAGTTWTIDRFFTAKELDFVKSSSTGVHTNFHILKCRMNTQPEVQSCRKKRILTWPSSFAANQDVFSEI